MNERLLITSMMITVTIILLLMVSPKGLKAVTGEDGSVWVRLNQPGFGDQDNVGIVVLCPFQGYLYALTRNDATGFELWKSPGTGWTRVTVPGFTDNNNYFGYLKPGPANTTDAQYNLSQNIWGDMIEFNGYLYVAVSSGYQGARLYGSVGLEIWRFDGITWQAMVSQTADSDESGAITAVSDCTDADAAYTAQITDSAKSWSVNQWEGCILRVVGEFDGSEGTQAGTPGIRVFDIISNTPDTLTVQENESADEDEYSICAEHSRQGEPGRPTHVVPGIDLGDSYTIECGIDEKGFGEIWNKSIVDFEILDGELYATIGLNYNDGTRIWKTSDGTNWTPTSDYSFGLFHGYDPAGEPTGFCLVPGLEGRNGTPVCSSSTNLGKSDVTGTMTLFTGGTGTSGCNGRGARVARLDGGEWNLIVDYFVDENSTGTNENGFGVSDDFFTSNFQAWSWAGYDSRLFVSVIRLGGGGGRVMYTATGSDLDGAWTYAVGGDNPTYADGFGDGSNIGSQLYVYDSSPDPTLYAGTIVSTLDNPSNGADVWKATGPGDNLTWTRVTGDGFGDLTVLQFEAFTTFGGQLYVAASNAIPSGFRGEEEAGFTGAKVFRLVTGTPEDKDGDGISDMLDNCPETPNGPNEGTCTDGYLGVACVRNDDCGTGGYCSMNQEEFDGDGAEGDACDNCPNQPNGPLLGTCVKTKSGMVVSYRVGEPKDFITCTSDSDCEASGGTCDMSRGDCNSNGCGDVCECLMDCNNEGAGDGKVTGSDLAVLKQEYGRFDCSPSNLCYADGNEDGKVTGSDLSLLKNEYGRFDCPFCP